MTRAVAGARAARRRQTEARLLDAALEVFCAHGYDAATTGAMARAAHVAAGTFYLHFRDKRAAYEAVARRAAHELLDAYRAALRPGMRIADRAALALRMTADFWCTDVLRARLLLEGGPSFGSEGHLRFVDDIAATFAAETAPAVRSVPRRALALLLTGAGIELGRVIVARPDPEAEIDELMRLVRRALAHLDLTARPGGHRGISSR